MRYSLSLLCFLVGTAGLPAQTVNLTGLVDSVALVSGTTYELWYSNALGALKYGGEEAFVPADVHPGDVLWFQCNRYLIGDVLIGTVENRGHFLFEVSAEQPLPASGHKVALLRENLFMPFPYPDIGTPVGVGLDAWQCIQGYYAERWTLPDAYILSKHLGTGVVSETRLASSAVTGSKIAQMGASIGQALTWNGSTWGPSTVSGGGTTPTSLNAGSLSPNLHNWAPSGYTSNTRHLTFQPSATLVYCSGLVKLAPGAVELILENTGAYSLILHSEDAGSEAANRFALQNGLLGIPPGRKVVLQYDETAARWKVSSFTPLVNGPKTTTQFESFVTLGNTPFYFDFFNTAVSGGSISTNAAVAGYSQSTVSFQTSSSTTGRYAIHTFGSIYLSDKEEAALFSARCQATSAAPDATDDYLLFVGFATSTDPSASSRVAALVATRDGGTLWGHTFASGNWHAVLYDGTGSAQVVDTGIAPAYTSVISATNMALLEVNYCKTGVRYFLNNSLVATLSTETTFNTPCFGLAAIDKLAGTNTRSLVMASVQTCFYDNL